MAINKKFSFERDCGSDEGLTLETTALQLPASGDLILNKIFDKPNFRVAKEIDNPEHHKQEIKVGPQSS